MKYLCKLGFFSFFILFNASTLIDFSFISIPPAGRFECERYAAACFCLNLNFVFFSFFLYFYAQFKKTTTKTTIYHNTVRIRIWIQHCSSIYLSTSWSVKVERRWSSICCAIKLQRLRWRQRQRQHNKKVNWLSKVLRLSQLLIEINSFFSDSYGNEKSLSMVL